MPRFRYGNYYGQEEFLIEMQANFDITPDLETILKVAGNVEAKTTARYVETVHCHEEDRGQGGIYIAEVLGTELEADPVLAEALARNHNR